MNWEISKNISGKYHHDGVCRSIGEVRSNNVRIFPGGLCCIIFLNEPIKKNCFFDHSVNFLVNFLSEDFAQTLRNDNLEG